MSVDRGSKPHVIYEFGDFRLDARRLVLLSRHSADDLQVKPKLVEALLYFVEHSGELLRKEALMAELWPGQVVEENNLAQVISSLRHILGESPRENRYLTTIPGRGYRFVADVIRLPEQDQPTTKVLETPQSAGGRGHRLRRWMVPLLVTATALSAAWFAFDRYEPNLSQRDLTTSSAGSDPRFKELPATTIAVMPFEDLSDSKNSYMAFGLTESILHRLADVGGLRVIARTSSFASKLRGVDAREAGRELHARYLVEGSVQRSGERMRATAQLIDATSGIHVWSLRFDRNIDDIFAVEDEIAQAVADALQVSLREPDHPHSRFGTQAYLAFLEGRALNAAGTLAAAELAVERFSEAIKISPDFAAAYVGLADTHRHIGYLKAHGPGRTPVGNPFREQMIMAEGGDKAGPLLAKALALDETLGEAYILRADLKVIERDYAGAEADYLTGIALGPNYSTGYEHYAEFLMRQGRREESLEAYDKAILVDPLAPQNYYGKAHLYLFSEETGIFSEQAVSLYLRALELDPRYYPALLRLAAIHWHQGRFAEAVTLAERALSIDPSAHWIRSFLVEFYLELGEVDAARSVLTEAGDAVAPVQWLSICLYAGKLETAVDVLRDGPHGRGLADNDIEAYVFRDAAIANGDPAQGRRELLAWGTVPGQPYRDPFGMVTLAQLAYAMGDRSEAEIFAQNMLDYVDPHARASPAHRLAYPRAAALTLLDRNDAAIALLEDSFARGFRKRWWYAFDRDPAFDTLRSDPRFLSLAESAHAHAAAERERLALLREHGDVPARALMQTPGLEPC